MITTLEDNKAGTADFFRGQSADSETQICRTARWLPLALDCGVDASSLFGPIDAALE
jgi:hypothetical protein